MQWPEGTGHDTGIDLVARERGTGALVAVQCKFYDPRKTISKQDVDTFLSESGKHLYAGQLVVSTTDMWGSNAEQAIHNQQIPVQRHRWAAAARVYDRRPRPVAAQGQRRRRAGHREVVPDGAIRHPRPGRALGRTPRQLDGDPNEASAESP